MFTLLLNLVDTFRHQNQTNMSINLLLQTRHGKTYEKILNQGSGRTTSSYNSAAKWRYRNFTSLGTPKHDDRLRNKLRLERELWRYMKFAQESPFINQLWKQLTKTCRTFRLPPLICLTLTSSITPKHQQIVQDSSNHVFLNKCNASLYIIIFSCVLVYQLLYKKNQSSDSFFEETSHFM